jgi:hypothetical protein
LGTGGARFALYFNGLLIGLLSISARGFLFGAASVVGRRGRSCLGTEFFGVGIDFSPAGLRANGPLSISDGPTRGEAERPGALGETSAVNLSLDNACIGLVLPLKS